MKEKIQAVILAGGKGTRLRPLTVYMPKPIVPLANKPLLEYQLELLSRAGITEAALSLSYQSNKIEDMVAGLSGLGIQMRFVTEPNPLGTSGGFRFAADPEAETFVVLNGDILVDLDLSEVLQSHREAKAEATIVIKRVDDTSRFGVVETAPDGRVLRFLEKPKADEGGNVKANTINAGIYILERKVLDLIPNGENSSFEYQIFPAILEKGLNFGSYYLERQYWRDIGNVRSYLEAHFDLMAGRVNSFARPEGHKAEIASTALVDAVSILGEGAVLKPSASVVNSVIGPGVQVEEKAVIEDSVIWAHTRVSSGAVIRGSLIGRSGFIGRNAHLGHGTVLGDKAAIPDYSEFEGPCA